MSIDSEMKISKDIADDLNRVQELKSEIAALESELSKLNDSTQLIQDNLHNTLLKQIEILTVFTAVISLIISNIIGLDAFGNIGIRGLVRVDLVCAASILIVLAGVKFFILGFRKYRK